MEEIQNRLKTFSLGLNHSVEKNDLEYANWLYNKVLNFRESELFKLVATAKQIAELERIKKELVPVKVEAIEPMKEIAMRLRTFSLVLNHLIENNDLEYANWLYDKVLKFRESDLFQKHSKPEQIQELERIKKELEALGASVEL